LARRANLGLLRQSSRFVDLPVMALPLGEGTMPIAIPPIAPPWREAGALRAGAQLERAGAAKIPKKIG
jgi:Asp-tRNA(Asn)/Glu-tRNA(Gln) amidotransferase A subunit family amidase